MYRVLILGCGAIAGGYDRDRPTGALPLTHAGAFDRDPRFALTACVDPDEIARSSFAKRWGVERHTATLDHLRAIPGEFEVISICSPTSLHAEHLDRAIALRPRVIFCEKPVAETIADAERLVAACARSNVDLVVNYTRRWAPDLVALAEKVRNGSWGRLLSAVGWYGKGIIHNGGHMIDLLRMFAGELQLIAASRPLFDHFADDPSVSALLETAGGASVHLVATDARALTRFELVLTCESGEIAMRDGGRKIELRRPVESDTFAGYRELGACKVLSGRYDEAMSQAVAEIGNHLAMADRSGLSLTCTGEVALAAQRLGEAIRIASLKHLKESTGQ